MKYWIPITVIIASLSLILWKATEEGSVVTFYTPQEIKSQQSKFIGKTFRMSGLVMMNSLLKKDSDLIFQVSDLKGSDFEIHYKGVPPDLFKEGQGVIIEGILTVDGFIQAQKLLVKHSEVYDTQKDQSELKKVRILESFSP